MSSGLCQIAAPYCTLGLITAVYSLLMYLNGVSHVILAMLDSTRANLVPFLVMWLRYEWNFSFWSKITPRYHASFSGKMVMLLSWMPAVVSSLVLCVKWMNMYLGIWLELCTVLFLPFFAFR